MRMHLQRKMEMVILEGLGYTTLARMCTQGDYGDQPRRQMLTTLPVSVVNALFQLSLQLSLRKQR